MLILLAWAALRLWPGDSDERRVSAPAPTAVPTKTAEPAPTDGTTTVALASGSSACDPESIRMTPSVADGQTVRQAVTIDLSIGSTSTKPCTFTADSTDLLVVISAGKTAIWDSTVCKTALLTDPVKLAPGWSTLVPAEWSGRGSGPACSAKEGWATPGRYTIQVGTLGGEPGQTKFTLDPAPRADKKKASDEESTKADEKKKSSDG